MKKFSLLFLSIVLSLVVISGNAFAEKNPAESNSGKNSNISENLNLPSLAAGCAVANASRDLDLNNVRALIQTGGDMWWDFKTAKYEVPVGSGKHSMYAGSLWIGGLDVNGQLKLAAQRFRARGNDYWPGPLNTETIDIDAPTCTKYDQHFVTTRAEVDLFNAWFNANLEDPAKAAIDYPGYTIPQSILDWPAHGNPANNESWNLAPFYDRDNDGNYNPYEGDYPGYEIETGGTECKTTRDVHLYGDKNLWWVFNDKGNIHTESEGAPIGMEIRAQAFAFATNDEINNMTFYNYELINRSTFSLTNTYFGVWADSDLGEALDDFVGCDVQRGLGYTYNGTEIDGTGLPKHYGANPPAIGIDFFEGPYQDNDSIDNPFTLNYNEAKTGNGIPYEGLGIGYGDSIIDNERFGMTRFLYHNNNTNGAINAITDPLSAPDYYNYLRGIWKDQTRMRYGGNGHSSGGGTGVECNYMFPGVTDPIGWGTGGTPQADWTEETEGNVPNDRRFAQSAGPFTLLPGAVNNITVGVVWARALSGGPSASVQKLKIVDDKAQALFNNCFRILNGPDAPDLSIKELDKELILTLNNRNASNNFNETYNELDFKIPPFEIAVNGDTIKYDNKYRFQGYLIYQVKDGTVTADDLGNPDLARIAVQCDIQDSVSKIINFRLDENLNANVPEEIVINGENAGIYNSFRILEDKFATGDRHLVNHKSYYFIAVAYGHNNYKKYNQFDPTKIDGQTQPYILSRKSVSGSIKSVQGIPHISTPLNGGTLLNSAYGDRPVITRIEGQGNGGLHIEFSDGMEDELFSSAGKIEFSVYKRNFGPVDIKVIDPLSIPDAIFELKLNVPGSSKIDTATWTLKNTTTFEIGGKLYNAGEYTVESERTIKVGNEQLIPEIGISVRLQQVSNPGDRLAINNGFILASLEFADPDPNSAWLTDVPDEEGLSPLNWVRSGTFTDPDNTEYDDYFGKDNSEKFEKLSFWAPYALTSIIEHGPAYNGSGVMSVVHLKDIKSIDVVITSDKDKWTRCPVIENQFESDLAVGEAEKNRLRKSSSVGKDGKPDGDGTGMGWFPGYAVCIETGERLNMAFSEDSWLTGENGSDMLWNPTSNLYSPTGGIRAGGKHFIYVFNNSGEIPAYDEGKKLRTLINENTNNSLRNAWKSCMWVCYPLKDPDIEFMKTDVRFKLRVSRSYEKYNTSSDINNDYPLYSFSLKEMAAVKGSQIARDSALSLVNVVPNPYYAYSEYETNQLDNRIKIINLPEECNITIYTVNGTLIRKFSKANPSTSLDWDLKNHVGIPISGGIYIIHVSAEGYGERALKWFGVMRPIDLQGF